MAALLATSAAGFALLRLANDPATWPVPAPAPVATLAPAPPDTRPATAAQAPAVAGEAEREASIAAVPPLVAPQAPAAVPAPAAAVAASEASRPLPPPQPLAFQPGWVQSVRPTALRAGPAEDAAQFTELPAQGYLTVLEARGDWVLVAYAGDGATRVPGTAWVRAADVAPPAVAPRWVKNHLATNLWSGTEPTAAAYTTLPQWSWLELMGREQQGRLLVRYVGDGRTRAAGEAWVDARDVGPVRTPRANDIPRAYPISLRSDVLRLSVPYRSQLDGTPWASANCGPATLGMALEGLGVSASSTELRRQVLDAQQIWSDDVGSFMEALVTVARANRVRVLDFTEGGALKRWTIEDVRRQVQAGRPVIAQVAYQALPGRAEAAYDGDHFIVITGLVGDSFLYNDSIDSDGVGFDRLMTAAELRRAMATATDRTYANAAFALARA